MFRKLLVTASIPLAMGAGLAMAQDGQQQEQAATPPPAEKVITEQSNDQTLSQELVGMEVKGPDGNAIGTLQSLLFDNDDRIVGGVVAVGGFMGIGAKQVALSWDQFEVRQDEGAVHVGLAGEQFEAAPDFKDRETQKAEENAARMEQERKQQMQQQQQRTSPPR